MHELHAALLALQELDSQIAATEARVAEFAPKLTTLEEPLMAMEREADAVRAKLEELRAEVQRLERNADRKRDSLKAYQDRLARSRNAREEAALHAEVDLVRGALDADLADVKQTAEQVTRTDLKLDDVRRQADRLSAEIAPQRDALLAARKEIEDELALLRDRRENAAVRLDTPSRRLYERLRTGRSRVVLAPLTDEGACGNCFNILPVQEQAMVGRGETLHRCEACGVILYVP